MSLPTDSHAHAHPSKYRYFVIYGILIGLTVLTYVTGKMHLGALALPLALVIAGTKVGLVVAFFMHLYDTRGAPLVTFTVSIIFVVTLLLGVFGDLVFRNPYSLPTGIAPTQYGPLGAPRGTPSKVGPMGNPKGAAPAPVAPPAAAPTTP